MPPSVQPEEETLEDLDIARLASEATRQAYEQALETQQSVLKVEQGNLVSVSRDGTQSILRKLPEPTAVTVGATFTRRPTNE